MEFIPNASANEFEVPYLDDARSDDGWQGQSTSESIASLRAQISAEIGRLGGTVTRWMEGTFRDGKQDRPGVMIEYTVVRKDSVVFEGRIKVAGLPWEPPYGGKKSDSRYDDAVKKKEKKSLAMALYNVREALKAMRILQVLSPGYAALVPWMLVEDTGRTVGELWGTGSPQLSPPEDKEETVEGSFKNV